MKLSYAVGALMSLAVFQLAAQTAPPPTFVVASIKPNTTGSNSSSSNGTKGQLVMQNIALSRLIERAYNLKPFQVSGPSWLNDAHFDIAAKMPADFKRDDGPAMLQALLVERFQLAVHKETKEMSAYALVIAKGGSKLTEANDSNSSTNSNGGHLKAEGTSMDKLADILSRMSDLPVVDKTGLTKAYNFTLDWTPEERPSSPGDSGEPKSDRAAGPTLFSAIQEQLGLRLSPQKLPVEILVIDHIERVPTEN